MSAFATILRIYGDHPKPEPLMRKSSLCILLSAAFGLILSMPAGAVDRDHQKSIEARALCAKQGRDGDAETLRKCCKNTVPTQARQADWDRYTQVCVNAKPAKADAASSGDATS